MVTVRNRVRIAPKASYTYRLPFPPSVNTYWRSMTRGKRQIVYISKAGKEFREQVLALIAKKACIKVKLAVSIDLLMPDRRERDIDNYQKALLDALQHARVYESDCQIDELHVRRKGVDPMGIGGCTVTIVEL